VQVLVPIPVTDAVLSSSTSPENDAPAWVSGQAYAAGALVMRVATHRVYERLFAGSGTTAPEADQIGWIERQATNRWAMFDDRVGSATQQGSGPLTVVLNWPSAVGALVLLGVTGSSVTATWTGGNRTQAVPAPVLAEFGSTVILDNLAAPAGSMTISITGTGAVACGTLAAGAWSDLGDERQGVQVGVTDYSRKEFDTFGSALLTRRGFARKLDVPVIMSPSAMDQAVRVLTALRATPAIYRAATWIDATVVYAWLREWALSLDDRSSTVTGSISVESLAMGVAA
jgi:hypothetical protein